MKLILALQAVGGDDSQDEALLRDTPAPRPARMSRLEEVIFRAEPSAAVIFRARAYGKKDARRFLRDVLSLANAEVSGSRLIVIGVRVGSDGSRELAEVPREAFPDPVSMQNLVREFIEPPLRVRLKPVYVSGIRLGIYELRDCHDRPYMMRADHCAELRRGDAWIRRKGGTFRLGRRELEEIFADKFRRPDIGQSIDVGFPGEFLGKDIGLMVSDASQPPSAIQAGKLRELLAAMKSPTGTGATTRLLRLTHARLFGADEPYRGMDAAGLEKELEQIPHKFAAADRDYHFGTHGSDLQLEVYNGSEESLHDVSLSVVLPRLPGFLIADRLTVSPGAEERLAASGQYPTVTLGKQSISVMDNLDDIRPGEKQDAFRISLRFCALPEAAGRSIALRYKLSASNLPEPKKGRLKIRFAERREDVPTGRAVAG